MGRVPASVSRSTLCSCQARALSHGTKTEWIEQSCEGRVMPWFFVAERFLYAPTISQAVKPNTFPIGFPQNPPKTHKLHRKAPPGPRAPPPSKFTAPMTKHNGSSPPNLRAPRPTTSSLPCFADPTRSILMKPATLNVVGLHCKIDRKSTRLNSSH